MFRRALPLVRVLSPRLTIDVVARVRVCLAASVASDRESQGRQEMPTQPVRSQFAVASSAPSGTRGGGVPPSLVRRFQSAFVVPVGL